MMTTSVHLYVLVLLLQVVLKCADIGHLAAAPRVHKRWAVQLEEEFFRQVSLTSKPSLVREYDVM